MEKQKENLFLEKFKLLNSQENSEEIIWTSSESSNPDASSTNDRLYNLTNRTRKRKRKSKNKVQKNIPNLNVTIIDLYKGEKDESNAFKTSKTREKCVLTSDQKPPLLRSDKVYFSPYKYDEKTASSPILSFKFSGQHTEAKLPEKSPILVPKYASPKNSPRVRKKLFKTEQSSERNDLCKVIKDRSLSPILMHTKEDTIKHISRQKSETCTLNSYSNSDLKSIENICNLEAVELKNDMPPVTNYNNEEVVITSLEDIEKENDSIKEELDDSFSMLKTKNTELVRRVKSFFDSHFSSSTTSQCTISEDLTPKHESRSSDDIEITNFITQINKATSPVKSRNHSNNSTISSQSAEMNEKSKKIKYKKDGLAFRLNALLKKHNASVSLWQHERFLAENSNFVIPKGEHLVFRIQKVSFKYGCYLIQAVDLNEEAFLILININFVQNNNIFADMVFKLYEPYKILDCVEYKLVINVCKFECIMFK